MNKPLRSRVLDAARDVLGRIPGALEGALILKDGLLSPDPATHPGVAFQQWLRAIDGTSVVDGGPGERRVLMFACNPPFIRLSLAIALVLAARNCRVDFAFLPDPESLVREDPFPVIKHFRFRYARTLRNDSHPRLRFFDLGRVPPSPVTPEMRREAEAQSRLDVTFLLLREEIDVVSDPEQRRVFEFRIRRNVDCMSRLMTLLRRNRYDVMLMFNAHGREFGAAFRAASLAGLSVTSFDAGERSGTILVSHGRRVTDMDTSKEWRDDEPHVLSPERRQRVEQVMVARRGLEGQGGDGAVQKSAYLGDSRSVRSRLSIDSNRRIVLLCGNITWDSAILGRDRAFPSLKEWARQTVAYFSDRRDSYLIVRAHPSETTYGTREPLGDVIRETCPYLPEHVRFVGPDDPTNTYDLMDACDVGLVYNSTTGLEMAMRGIPVIVAGQPHYSGKGFVRDVESRAAYVEALDQALRQPNDRRLEPRLIELAWCYADVYFFQWHRPFPWYLYTQVEGRWPVARVLSEEGWSRFGRTFEMLVET